ncbi:flagellar hook-basal body protein [Rummeliibacillus pycnus]|uniref:flagellar hook-basal body protein n=1 Tax=Rummeliibacillus pycnus TaxID=101070 RepID=UPI003D28DE3A
MLRTMISATNTMSQLQEQLDTISNNMANSNTHGFKAKETKFNELLYQQFENDKQDKVKRQSPVGIRIGVGARLGQAQTNWKQGGIQQTNRALDFTFTKPKQYFNILMPDGKNGTKTVYTRQGDFYLSPLKNGNAMLVNTDGYPVADANGNAIVLKDDAKDFSVTEDGMLNVKYNNNTSAQIEIGVTEVEKPQLMQHISDTYIGLPDNFNQLGVPRANVLKDLKGVDRAQVAMQNGGLEMSNVDISKEMTDLISTQRSYQFNARTITLADQMMGLVNEIR